MKRYDLMQDVNTRGTFLLSRSASAPARGPTRTSSRSARRSASTRSGTAASRLHAGEVRDEHVHRGHGRRVRAGAIAFNSLWPRTLIATAAVQNLLGGDAAMARSRRPEIVADAAHHILTRPARTTTGNFFIDDEVLADGGRQRPERRTPT